MINTVYFGTYAVMQRVFQADPNIPLTTTQASIAGAISGVSKFLVLIDSHGFSDYRNVYRCSCGAHQNSAPSRTYVHFTQRIRENNYGVWHKSFVLTQQMASSIFKEEGLKGFSRGFGVTLLREVPCIGCFFLLILSDNYSFILRTIRVF